MVQILVVENKTSQRYVGRDLLCVVNEFLVWFSQPLLFALWDCVISEYRKPHQNLSINLYFLCISIFIFKVKLTNNTIIVPNTVLNSTDYLPSTTFDLTHSIFGAEYSQKHWIKAKIKTILIIDTKVPLHHYGNCKMGVMAPLPGKKKL